MANHPLHNWPAAFVAFCQNHPLEEISSAFDIPMSTLRATSSAQKWAALRAQLPIVTNAASAVLEIPNAPGRDPMTSEPGAVVMKPVSNALPAVTTAKFEALMANRKLNYDQADRLRRCLDGLLTKLEAGELTVDHISNSKAGPVHTARHLNLQDYVALATYAKLVQDMTYRALGDNEAGGKGQDKAPAERPPPITIVLPGIISEPRERRGLQATLKPIGRVVEIEAEVMPPGSTGTSGAVDETSGHAPQAPDAT
jgi:hypothetical protein